MDIKDIKIRLKELNKENTFTKYNSMMAFLKDNGITIRFIKRVILGRCYEAVLYEVQSKEQLPVDFVYFLRDLSLIENGQEFYLNKVIEKDGGWSIFVESRIDSSD